MLKSAMYQKSWNRISKRLALVWSLLVITICQHTANAATINNRNTQSLLHTSGIGEVSLPKRKTMEPSFDGAGTQPGLEIWRIENFKPVPYPKKDYGKFYTGDSYIVLYTNEHHGTINWDIHFWLGSETSQDEAGAAAILSVALDDQLGGDPVQYREVQDHESQLFLSRFKSGIRYLPGGVSSGFSHVDRNAFEKKLFQVKGKRNIRVKQVDVSIAAMNRGDCFILDVGNEIFLYVGDKSKPAERLKAISAANLIRDQDHGGRSKIHIIDRDSSQVDKEGFFNALGSGSPADVPDETVGGDDAQFETAEERSVALYRISDKTGKLEIELVSEKPLKQDQLDTNDCFILDTVDANVFVWIGKQCTKKEKDEAMNKAQAFLSSKNYPTWTHIERVVENAEPAIFTQYFQGWKGVGELHPRRIRSAAVKPTKLAAKSGGEVPEFMPDNGSGELEIYRIENFELAPVNPENYGKFFGGDSYVIKYRDENGKWIIYYWQGNESSLDEKAASALQAVKLDNELNGKAVQIRVVQNHEPKHFLHIFKGKLITFLGGHASGFKNIKDHDTYVEGETRLYCVRGTNEENVRAFQKIASANSLASDDVFIVENGDNVWLWIGKNSDDVEKELGNSLIQHLAPKVSYVTIQENEEPPEFWDALGGKKPYNRNFEANISVINKTCLYHCHVSPSGKVAYEEISDFDQSDLDDEDVMVLDSTEEVYVWFGKLSTEHERESVIKDVTQLLKRFNRETAVIMTVKQGEEPELFTSLFYCWNSDSIRSSTNYEKMKQKLHEENPAIED